MKKIFISLFLSAASLLTQAQTLDTVISPNFLRVEVESEFPGGKDGWKQYLVKNLKSSVPVKNNAPIGVYQVVVRFIVSKEGKISDVAAETNHGYGMEEEVIRILKKGPDWLPAQQNGRKVNAYRRQPVTFVVQQDNIKIEAKDVLGANVQNTISIAVNKVDDEFIEPETDNGTISKAPGAGKYILVPANPGKAIVSIYSTKKGKRKSEGKACFTVAAL